jgi:nucleotide-binding universal stress UspA family protein
VTVTGVVGDTADAILDTSESVDADTIFMSGRKRRPTGKAVFGSSVQEVMLNADCPVTYVREGMHVD